MTSTPRTGLVRRLLSLFPDPGFLGRLFALALPIASQQFLVAGLSLAVSLVVGRLGDVPVAAVGLCTQILFLFNLLLFGIASGASIFTAQFWGQRDVANIRRVLGLALTLSLAGGALFTLVTLVFPEAALRIYTRDPAVIALGRSYLKVAGWSCLFWAVSFTYSVTLRSVGEARTPLAVSVAALAFNLALSYGLVLGRLGLPRLGAVGAAYGLGLSRGLECLLLLAVIYRRRMPVAGTLRELLSFDRRLAQAVLQRTAPVMLSEVLWSAGVTVYNIIYARLGTDALAAVNMIWSIDNLAYVPFLGLANACGILVGHAIGAGDERRAFRQAGATLGLAVLGGALQGLLLWAAAGKVLALYQVSAATAAYARAIIIFLALGYWVRAANFVLLAGIVRAGGDTRFALFVDVGTTWGVGVTLAWLGAFVLHWPAPLVYGLTLGDEAAKMILLAFRFLSRKWMHRLTQAAVRGAQP